MTEGNSLSWKIQASFTFYKNLVLFNLIPKVDESIWIFFEQNKNNRRPTEILPKQQCGVAHRLAPRATSNLTVARSYQ
jgi:hypothetical protein